MQTRRQKHNPGSLWTGNPGMSNTVFCMHVSRCRCEWQVFSSEMSHARFETTKTPVMANGSWLLQGLLLVLLETFLKCLELYTVLFALHYPSLQWRCMPPNVQKPLKKHEHAFEMHFSPEPLCNIGKITCVSCCTSPRSVFLRCFRVAIGRYKKS